MNLLGCVLLHFLWQGCVIGGVTAVVLPFLSRASTRYQFLSLALLACPLCCFITAASLQNGALPVENSASQVVSDDEAVPSSSNNTTPAPEVSGPVSIQNALPWLVMIWQVGVLFISVRLVRDWLHLRRCVKKGRKVDPNHRVNRVLAELGLHLRVRTTIRLLESTGVEVPTLIGWLRPTILLPVEFLTGLPLGQIEAILAHELAHIRRNDFLFNGLQVVIETLLFYHPLVGWISHRIREERENCCDDIAMDGIGDRAAYATALLALEEGRVGQIQLAANGGSLLKRIRRIAQGPERDSPSLLLPVLLVMLLMELFIYVGRAQAEPPVVKILMAQPVPELLTKVKSPRKFLIHVTLEGNDLMKTIAAPPELQAWYEHQFSLKVNCHKIDLSQKLQEGQTVEMYASHAFPYPDTFDQPALIKDAGRTAIIPMTPTDFETCSVGWSLQFKATVTGGFINLKADAFFTKAQLTKAVYGENTEPIYASVKDSSGKTETALLTQNQAFIPSFETSHTPFYLFAQPNKDYHVKLQQGTDWINATIRVEIVP